MNRTLKRPMFRRGGSAGSGITSGLDRPGYKDGTEYDRAMKVTERYMQDVDRFRGSPSPFAATGVPGFLTSFGLDLLSRAPTGNIFQTASLAAKGPFEKLQQAQMLERERKGDRAEDIFTTALASEYDLAAKRIKEDSGGDSRTTPEVERQIIMNAQQNIFDAKDILNDPNSTEEQKKIAQRTIKLNENVLTKELGVPVEYASIIGSPELFDAEMTSLVEKYNQEQEMKAKEFLANNPDKNAADALAQFPKMIDGSAEARAYTMEQLKEKYGYASGGRVGYSMGSEPRLMGSVVEQQKETGEVQDLSYTELRARLPQEISNDIVMLLSQSKQALLDFANIQTTEDISNFNQQYNVDLTLPQGA